jgi:protein O-mannosyl-transferase
MPRKSLLLVFAIAAALYLPTLRFGVVQDDRAIVAANPAAHSLGAAVRGFAQPYWPPPSEGGLYRPLTILSFAVDWTISGGRVGWLHVMNALWYGLAAALVVVVLWRWLPGAGAVAAGLIFALHPLHVEGVASLVSRAELLAGVGLLGGIVAARRGWWAAAVALAVMALFSKEHGVVTGVAILIDDWLQGPGARRYPIGLYLALAVATFGFIGLWWVVGRQGAVDVAPPFIGATTGARLALAGPAVLRAARLLVWPLDLSADYGPQVIRVRDGLSLAAVGGAFVVAAVPALVWWCRRRAPAIALAAGVAALTYLPTSNLFFPSGVVLAERNLFLAVLLPAAAAGLAAEQLRRRWGWRPMIYAVAVLCLLLGTRSVLRLPAWRDNRALLLRLLAEHPESSRAHASAAGVLAGVGDSAGARRQYEIADSLFSGDPIVDGARAFFLYGAGDTAQAAAIARRARSKVPRNHAALRTQFLLARRRGDVPAALAIADTAGRWFPSEQVWYRQYLQLVR